MSHPVDWYGDDNSVTKEENEKTFRSIISIVTHCA
ncbi:predicted protein [Sclerotinia sclerotiorum 1980 UF-70]|uniref:Uncharacterized protein n=1 Tax=Sclerotinia sclerotiorum (strain ATCC 18683 / 1980 / Ss-1) TaxID=665079 RepID=A7F9B6_SCLS1|nr:predicted protein [Sclerotinia sclerotiorum 1980 UF-70]EDO00327.1 predicted protein [Sclerotinia sclerotiorum 1980 UF-70]